MPNHIVNKIEADSKTMEKIIKLARGEEIDGTLSHFTFNRIVPFPGGEYTCQWGRENWGTKWDAYEHCIRPRSIWFLTAWEPAKKVYETLSRQVGRFTVTFADEGLPEHGGKLIYENGECVLAIPPKDGESNSKVWAAYSRARKLNGDW